MNLKEGKTVVWLFQWVKLHTTISLESSWQDLFLVVDAFTFKNNQNAPFPNFACSPKTGIGLPKTVRFFNVIF